MKPQLGKFYTEENTCEFVDKTPDKQHLNFCKHKDNKAKATGNDGQKYCCILNCPELEV